MYKDTIGLPQDSNGKSLAHWVDSDGYHQSMMSHWLPTFSAAVAVTFPTAANTIFAMYNASQTNDVLISRLAVSAWDGSSASPVPRNILLDRINSVTAGTAQPAPTAHDTGDAWDAGVSLLVAPSGYGTAGLIMGKLLREQNISDMDSANYHTAQEQENMIALIPHGKPIRCRYQQGIGIRELKNYSTAGIIFIWLTAQLINVS